MNARKLAEENLRDVQVALRDELQRYLAACRPLLRRMRDAQERLRYLDWVETLENEGPNQVDRV